MAFIVVDYAGIVYKSTGTKTVRNILVVPKVRRDETKSKNGKNGVRHPVPATLKRNI